MADRDGGSRSGSRPTRVGASASRRITERPSAAAAAIAAGTSGASTRASNSLILFQFSLAHRFLIAVERSDASPSIDSAMARLSCSRAPRSTPALGRRAGRGARLP